jgi:hypothetical protein
MNSYRLLRSNKETGPYTEVEMIAMGFKAYDLIWVEGKSAGWRYPSELPEFQPYAPVTEEQPYDRFYKKPAATTPVSHTAESMAGQDVLVATPPVKKTAKPEPLPEEPVKAPAYIISPSAIGKHIYVTFPSGSSPAVAPAARKEPVEKVAAKPERASTPGPLLHFDESSFPKRETASMISPAPPVRQKANPLYSLLQKNKFTSFTWTTVLGMVVGVATLVGLGILIGLSITRQKNDIAVNEFVKKPLQEAQPLTVDMGGNSAQVSKPDPAAVKESPALSHQPPAEPREIVAKKIPVRTAELKNTRATVIPVKTEQPIVVKKPESGPGEQAVAENAATPQKKNSVNTLAASLDKDVGFKINQYKVGAFGGISDVQCTLVNDSRVPLGLVEVELEYILSNNKVFKTETLSFKDVAAGTRIMLNAPRSPRGIKVTGKIKKVSVRENNFTSITVKS